MPIYEYQCQSCGHEFEALQKISDPLLTDCPQCREAALKKKVSAAAFRLKGGGWYETDFKTANRKNVVGDKSADDKSKPAESGSTDKKTGDKKESASKSGGDSGKSTAGSSKAGGAGNKP